MDITWSICLLLPPGLLLALSWHSGGKASCPFQSPCLAEALSTPAHWEPSLAFQAAGQTIGKLLGAKRSYIRGHVPLGPLSVWRHVSYLLSFSEVSQPVMKVFKNKIEEENQRGKPLPSPACGKTSNSVETASSVAWVFLRGFMPHVPARICFACEMWWNHKPRQCCCERFFFISFHLCSLTLSNNNN